MSAPTTTTKDAPHERQEDALPPKRVRGRRKKEATSTLECEELPQFSLANTTTRRQRPRRRVPEFTHDQKSKLKPQVECRLSLLGLIEHIEAIEALHSHVDDENDTDDRNTIETLKASEVNEQNRGNDSNTSEGKKLSSFSIISIQADPHTFRCANPLPPSHIVQSAASSKTKMSVDDGEDERKDTRVAILCSSFPSATAPPKRFKFPLDPIEKPLTVFSRSRQSACENVGEKRLAAYVPHGPIYWEVPHMNALNDMNGLQKDSKEDLKYQHSRSSSRKNDSYAKTGEKLSEKNREAASTQTILPATRFPYHLVVAHWSTWLHSLSELEELESPLSSGNAPRERWTHVPFVSVPYTFLWLTEVVYAVNPVNESPHTRCSVPLRVSVCAVSLPCEECVELLYFHGHQKVVEERQQRVQGSGEVEKGSEKTNERVDAVARCLCEYPHGFSSNFRSSIESEHKEKGMGESASQDSAQVCDALFRLRLKLPRGVVPLDVFEVPSRRLLFVGTIHHGVLVLDLPRDAPFNFPSHKQRQICFAAENATVLHTICMTALRTAFFPVSHVNVIYPRENQSGWERSNSRCAGLGSNPTGGAAQSWVNECTSTAERIDGCAVLCSSPFENRTVVFRLTAESTFLGLDTSQELKCVIDGISTIHSCHATLEQERSSFQSKFKKGKSTGNMSKKPAAKRTSKSKKETTTTTNDDTDEATKEKGKRPYTRRSSKKEDESGIIPSPRSRSVSRADGCDRSASGSTRPEPFLTNFSPLTGTHSGPASPLPQFPASPSFPKREDREGIPSVVAAAAAAAAGSSTVSYSLLWSLPPSPDGSDSDGEGERNEWKGFGSGSRTSGGAAEDCSGKDSSQLLFGSVNGNVIQAHLHDVVESTRAAIADDDDEEGEKKKKKSILSNSSQNLNYGDVSLQMVVRSTVLVASPYITFTAMCGPYSIPQVAGYTYVAKYRREWYAAADLSGAVILFDRCGLNKLTEHSRLLLSGSSNRLQLTQEPRFTANIENTSKVKPKKASSKASKTKRKSIDDMEFSAAENATDKTSGAEETQRDRKRRRSSSPLFSSPSSSSSSSSSSPSSSSSSNASTNTSKASSIERDEEKDADESKSIDAPVGENKAEKTKAKKPRGKKQNVKSAEEEGAAPSTTTVRKRASTRKSNLEASQVTFQANSRNRNLAPIYGSDKLSRSIDVDDRVVGLVWLDAPDNHVSLLAAHHQHFLSVVSWQICNNINDASEQKEEQTILDLIAEL